MIYFAIGVLIAGVAMLQAKAMGMISDKGYFTNTLIMIASLYILFSVMSGGEGLLEEAIVATIFMVIATLGGKKYFVLIGVGLILHGVFDVFHNSFIENSGVPEWYPMFCLGADLVLGSWVIYIAKFKQLSTEKI